MTTHNVPLCQIWADPFEGLCTRFWAGNAGANDVAASSHTWAVFGALLAVCLSVIASCVTTRDHIRFP